MISLMNDSAGEVPALFRYDLFDRETGVKTRITQQFKLSSQSKTARGQARAA
jgi:hypothetical protein